MFWSLTGSNNDRSRFVVHRDGSIVSRQPKSLPAHGEHSFVYLN